MSGGVFAVITVAFILVVWLTTPGCDDDGGDQ